MAPNQENIEAKLCAYVDDELTAQERTEIEQHLAANPHHRRLLRELAQTRNLLRSLPRAKSPADLVEGFQSQLERSALLNDEPEEPSGVLLRIDRRPQILSAAAILLLAVGLGFVIYRTLPSSNPPREVVIAPSGTTPGLVTTDDSGASGPASGDGAPGFGGGRLAPSDSARRKEMAERPQPTPSAGGGSGGGAGARVTAGRSAGLADGTMGGSELSKGSEFRDKGGVDSAKQPAGKPLAGPEDVVSAQDRLAKQDSVRNGATAANSSTAALTTDRIPSAQPNGSTADEMPVVVLVNTTNPSLANGDVSSYLRQNNIAFSAAETETTPVPTPASGMAGKIAAGPVAAAPAPPTPVPAVAPATLPPGEAERVARQDEISKKQSAVKEEKKVGWYMGSDGQMHYRLAADTPEPAPEAAAKGAPTPAQVDTMGVATSGTVSGIAQTKAKTSTTQPLRGIELANSYSLNGSFGNSTGNSVTYHAVMSRRQVVDLNTRLSQREGQSAQVRSDAIVNRPEGVALTDNIRQNGGKSGANATSVTVNAVGTTIAGEGDRDKLDQAVPAGPQSVGRARGSKNEQDPTRRNDAQTRDAKSLASAMNESKGSSPDPAEAAAQEQAKDLSASVGRPGAIGANRSQEGPTEVEKIAPQTASIPGVPNAPVASKGISQADQGQQVGPAAGSPVIRQQQDMKPSDPPTQVESPQSAPVAAVDGAVEPTTAQILPPTSASASGSQGIAVQSASVAAIQQLGQDDQPREVLIVVAAPVVLTPAPAQTTPTTQPATATPAPASAKPAAPAPSILPDRK